MDRSVRSRIKNYLETRVAMREDPRSLGKRLSGDLSFLWRYRVGDYRVLCRIQDDVLVVLVVSVGDRKEVYKGR